MDFQYSPTCRLLGFLLRNGCVLGQGKKVFFVFWIYGVRGVLVISYKRVVWEFQMRVEVVKDLQAF